MVQNQPRGAAYTPRTIMKLELCITKKNKHNSRINISFNYRILIISAEVCFEIKRQYAKVGCKNLIFSYKNHLGRFCKNGKNYKKDLQHNFVQFLV
jgi:peroxiredoxin